MRSYYSATALLGCIVLCLLFIRMKDISADEENKKRYAILVLASILLGIADTFWGICYKGIGNELGFAFTLSTYFYFTFTALANFAWVRFAVAQMEFRPTATKVYYTSIVLLAIQALLLVTNPFTHNVFFITYEGFYQTGPLRSVLFGLQAANGWFMLWAYIYYWISSPVNSLRKKYAKYGTFTAALPMLVVFLAWYKKDSPMYSLGYLAICLCIYVLDITHLLVRKNAELEIQKNDINKDRDAIRTVYETSKKTGDAKNELFTKMTHDMVGPLNDIMNLTAVGSMELNDPVHVLDAFSKIQLQAEKLLKSANEVLYMNKTEGIKANLVLEECSIPEFGKELQAAASALAKEYGNTVTITCKDLKHPYIMADKERTAQACMGLLNNSIKYTPAGGQITMTMEELPTARDNFALIQICVEDNGIGMSEEDKEHMFEPFYRSQDPRVQAIKGSGLGLPVVQNMAAMANGTIEVETELNKGTKITCTAFFEIPKTPEATENNSVFGRIALIVDRDVAACECLVYELEELGIHSKYYLTPTAAINHLKQLNNPASTYCTIILDNTSMSEPAAEIAAVRALVGNNMPIFVTVAGDIMSLSQNDAYNTITGFIPKPAYHSRIERALSVLFK
ncbi:MAG: HAMP domain-containing histidine kinase [Pseudobutyrivibrio sp.]|nr:HAMP domain-containing histidine kinase [Pseudobutyrivibrio sp.]